MLYWQRLNAALVPTGIHYDAILPGAVPVEELANASMLSRQLLTALTGQRHLGKVSVMVLRLLSDGNGRPRTKDVNGVLRLCNWELTRLVPASVQRPRSPGSPTAYATPTTRSVGLVHSGQFRLRVAFVFFTVKVRVS